MTASDNRRIRPGGETVPVLRRGRAAGIVGGVRAALLATAATLAALAVLAVAIPAPALAQGPSAEQIQRAAGRAERSASLWATINGCSSRGTGRGGSVGVRGQMPALGFSATERMTIRLGWWSAKRRRFEAIDGSSATSNLSLGSTTSGRQQDGVDFAFRGSPGLLDASIDFTWTRAGRIVAEAVRITTADHHDADYAKPAHYSAASCRLH